MEKINFLYPWLRNWINGIVTADLRGSIYKSYLIQNKNTIIDSHKNISIFSYEKILKTQIHYYNKDTK